MPIICVISCPTEAVKSAISSWVSLATCLRYIRVMPNSYRQNRRDKTVLSRRRRVGWCQSDNTPNVFRLPQTVADSNHTARYDATRWDSFVVSGLAVWTGYNIFIFIHEAGSNISNNNNRKLSYKHLIKYYNLLQFLCCCRFSVNKDLHWQKHSL